jgi:hypothetical protein
MRQLERRYATVLAEDIRRSPSSSHETVIEGIADCMEYEDDPDRHSKKQKSQMS